MPRIAMDIHEFLGANYGDLFDPPECNFNLQDSLNNDWLENIFSSSSLSPSSSSSTSSSTSAPMTGIDDLLPGSTSPDSVHYEHSYSMGSCDSSPSLDSWPSSSDKGDPFEFLRDLGPPIFDLGCNMIEETGTRIKEEDGLDLDRWMESSSSSSPSFCDATETAAVSPSVERQTRKSIVLLTDTDGQTMTFTSDETNSNNSSEELILVDWNYEEQQQQHKDPIDLSMYKGKLVPLSNGKKDGPTFIHQSTAGLTVTSFSSPWHKQEGRNTLRSYTLTEALFSNPVPTDGLLLLTDEEKNTLVAEGYPVPTKLPLGKAEEKHLKKIRRKIKNKISAQESRRKKKEYMDHLELKMHKYCQENSELTKKVEQLESNNRQLLVQLRSIQKILKSVGSAPGGTSLMVLVLFFAAFIGSWSPISWSIGYGRLATVSMIGAGGGSDQVSAARVGAGVGAAAGGGVPMPCAPFIGPDLQHPMVEVYSTVSGRRSRLLMSTRDEDDAYNDSSNIALLFGPTVPASYMQTLAYWLSSVTGGKVSGKEDQGGDQKAEDKGNEELGFSVRHILPLMQHSLSKKTPPPTLTANETFSRPLSNSQPLLPFPVADQLESHEMEL